MTEYNFKRLCFKKAIIEKLASDEAFRVNTPVGVFELTRKQFEDTFASVLLTASWQVYGIYHWPVVPKKALKYLV